MAKNKLYIMNNDNPINNEIDFKNKNEILIKQYQSALNEKNEYIKNLMKNNSHEHSISLQKNVSAEKLLVFADAEDIYKEKTMYENLYNKMHEEKTMYENLYNKMHEEKTMYENLYKYISNAFFWKISKPIRLFLDIIKKIFKKRE